MNTPEDHPRFLVNVPRAVEINSKPCSMVAVFTAKGDAEDFKAENEVGDAHSVYILRFEDEEGYFVYFEDQVE